MSTDLMPGRYSVGEEIAHTATHGAGLLLSMGGLAVLLTVSSRSGDAWLIASVCIYGVTLIALYATSTLYHGFPDAKAGPVLQKLDHAAIYLLIAGTYTPFTLVNLRGSWGLALFALVWSIAITGMVLDLVARKRNERLSLSLYLGLGWVILIAIKPLFRTVEVGGLLLLLAGGLCYSGGVIFYVWKTLPYHHAAWHLCVLAGSVLHFFAVLFYVIPTSPG